MDELLNFLVGRSVPLNDLFRLGRRKKTSDSVVQVRPWPVMLQPLSSWDRRLVLSAVRKLKGYTVSNIYSRENLSPVERQKCRERFGTRTVAAASKSLTVDFPLFQPLYLQLKDTNCNWPRVRVIVQSENPEQRSWTQ